MPWAGLARPVGAEEDARGSRNNTQKKRGHLQYEIFVTPASPSRDVEISFTALADRGDAN